MRFPGHLLSIARSLAAPRFFLRHKQITVPPSCPLPAHKPETRRFSIHRDKVGVKETKALPNGHLEEEKTKQKSLQV